MMKTTMNDQTKKTKVVRLTALLAALLMVLLPTSGIGGFAKVAYAVEADQDTSLTTFTIDGVDVTDGASINADYGTASVDVVAIPTNVDATVAISGDTGLVSGSNSVSVLVTAADDVTTKTYTVNVEVASNNDTDLGVFSVDGVDVVNGGTVNLDFGTTAVDVIAEPADIDATVEVSGDINLVTGNNTLTVVVTAADGTTATNTVTLVVAANNDASLGVFSVDGEDVVDGATVELLHGTTAVDVIAEPTDIDATVEVAGDKSLHTGNNTLTVTVTAADGTTTGVSTVTLHVAANNDSSLGVFAINSTDVTDGATVNVAKDTTSVTVVAEAADPNAAVVIVGDTGLTGGNNTLTVTVTAEDGVTKTTYTVTIVVAVEEFSNDTSLSTFKVDGKAVVDLDTVRIAQGRSSVSVEVVTNDALAVATVAGNTGLQDGNNDVTVTVTADDGTVKVYTIHVVVAVPSSDASISSVKIDGTAFTGALDGTGEYNAVFGTSEVTVAVTPGSGYSSVSVSGNTGLDTGSNTVSIHVVAEDGTTADYSFKVIVAAANTNTGITSFKVNDASVSDGDTVTLEYGTSEVSVDVVTAAATSTYTISGATGLTTGSHTLTVTVTAQSGATANYSVTLTVVAASANTNITSITVNGETVVDNAIALPAGTDSAVVLAELESPFASYTVSGDGTVTTGTQNLTITVTAQDGTQATRQIAITVPEADTNNQLDSITVNGQAATDGSTIEVANGTATVTVVATAVSAKATVIVSGNTDLQTGNNTVNISITSESGATANYSVIVKVAPSANTNLTSLIVNNTEVISSLAVTTSAGASSVDVTAVTEDDTATYVVEGATGLHTGENFVTVTVTAGDGGSFKVYTVTVTVPVASTDNTLASITVDGTTVAAGVTIDKAHGITSVEVVATPNDAHATVVITGDTDLHSGSNTVNIAVTAENGDVAYYSLTIVIAASSNTNLTSLIVDNVNVLSTLTFTTDFGATRVDVTAVTEDPDATFEVTDNDHLIAGNNDVTLKVIAADGTMKDYTIVVTVPVPSNDNSLGSITVDGEVVANGATINRGHGVPSVAVIATANSDKATVVVSGDTELQTGENTVSIAITAEDGTVANYNFKVVVAASNDSNLGSIIANGKGVAVDGTLSVEPGTTSVVVVALANDPDATVEVTGNTDLSAGNNTVTIVVTAADGTSSTYHFVIEVLSVSNNANLSTFTIDGNDALAGGTINVGNEIDDATVIVQTESANASFQITSGTALAVGENTISVEVTAEDGTKKTYSVTVVRAVALSANTELGSIKIGETDIAVGSTFDVVTGTTSVTVDATAADVKATVEVLGATDLKAGENTVSVVVTAENGDTAIYNFIVKVALSDNTNVTEITVNGNVLDLADLNFTVGSATTSVIVAATVEDVDATYSVNAPETLAFGANDIVITVTAANGVATHDYTVVVTRTPLSTNTDIGTITVNGNEIAVDGTFEVDPGVTSAFVVALAADPDATTTVSDTTNLVPGDNPVTIVVTAADGVATAQYMINIFVKSLSNDTTLKTFTLNGADVNSGDTITLDGTVNFVTVIAQANFAGASVVVSGSADLPFGPSDVVVTVTAEDGTVATYTVTVILPNIRNINLTTFQVNTEDVHDGDVINLPPYTTDVELTIEAEDPAATVDIAGGTDLQPGENTVTVTVTAVDGETVKEYTITLMVALGDNVELATFTIAGEAVSDGDVLDFDPYTTEVEIVAEPVDTDATVEIVGGTELESGESDVVVTVTAADGVTKATYTVTLNVAEGDNVELATFSVNGNDVVDGDRIDIEPYTTEVEVVVETVDPDAIFEITGDTDLVQGDSNVLTVMVTAANGVDIAEYAVILNVLLGNDVTISKLVVGDVETADGESVEVMYGTSEVAVVVETTDPLATYNVVGGVELLPGENTVTITVTAQDGTTADYTVTVVVLPNSDASLSSLTVEGVEMVDGEVIDLPYGTTSVQIIAVATDELATVDISGGTDLATGENEVVITVTAADGETIQEYFLTLNVALNDDTSLAVFQVNGTDVQDGSIVDLLPYTTEVEVNIETTDADATFEVEGGTELVSGDNLLTVFVTAANGEASEVYNVTLSVALGNDVTLATFQINGNDAVPGEAFTLEPRTTTVEVTVETTDPDATYTIAGDGDVQVGENILVVTVTAADGSTSIDYTVVMTLVSSDATLAEFTVNGSPVESGDYVELELGTSSVEVVATPTEEAATVEISGASELQPGENTLTVTVVAPDGDTTIEYTVTLFVLLSTDTSLSVFTINGEAVEDGSSLEFPANTTSVEVVAEATNENAQVDIVGGDLVAGDNTVEVTVTAEDGETVFVYVVSIYVDFSNDNSVTEILVDGQVAIDKDVILGLDLEMTEVDVEVTATDENATVEVSGNTELHLGDNLITITVTAHNGDTRDYTVTFRLGGIPGNAKLKSLTVGTTNIDVALGTGTVTLQAGTRFVPVLATTEDSAASVIVTGNKSLVVGENTITVTVKAADGKTSREYTVIATVLALSANKNLAALTVNGTSLDTAVDAVRSVTLRPGAGFAEVFATAADSGASVTYSGVKNLVAGNNTATVRVTAANGEFADYVITLVVPSLSSDKTLKTFTIEGFNVMGKTKLSVISGTRKLHITALANNSGASVAITGRDIVPGNNTVTVTVTAADGTTATYTVIVKVKA